jgi:SAM-dependent methyltransferase
MGASPPAGVRLPPYTRRVTDEFPVPAHAERNRERWDAYSAEYQARHGGQLAESRGAAWGVWQIPESELRVLGDVAGRDVLELGCGAAQWSIALAGMGARVTGLDTSARQLEQARALMSEAGVDFALIHGDAESTGLPGASFDIVFCDHGALRFSDPRRTVPEAARLLRPGGLLAFSMYTPILDMAWEVGAEHPGDRLALDYWDLHALPEEPDEPIDFQLPYGAWIRLFRESGLVVEDLIEIRPPPDASSSYVDETDREWARRWPLEHIWRARRS